MVVAAAAIGGVLLVASALQLSGTLGVPTEAVAATVLDHAAAAAASSPPLPLPDSGWIYREIVRQNGPTTVTVQMWEAVDGRESGLTKVTADGETRSMVTPRTDDSILASSSLKNLAVLSENPAQLLSDLRNDPATRADVQSNGVDVDVALWGQVRTLSERIPVQRQWALFQAAKEIDGLEVEADVQDVAGRSGTALGLDDPRLGLVQLIFSDEDGRFLGERILR